MTVEQPPESSPAIGRHPARTWLAVLVVVHLALGVVFDRATPVFEAPDEGYHMAFIRWVAQGGGLPVQRPGQAADWAQEGSQPPLYHLLAAGLLVGLDTSDWAEAFIHNPFLRHEPGITANANAYRHRAEEYAGSATGTVVAVHALRGLSLALSAVTIALTYGLALAVFPGRGWLALLAAALAALNPQALFINAALNNDNLLMPLSTAALWVMVDLLRPDAHAVGRKAAGLGVLLGLAALTKLSGLVLWPVAAAVVGWRALQEWRRPTTDGRRRLLGQATFVLRRSSFVWHGMLMFLLALALCGWWYWRNFALYGEWLGLETMVSIAGPRTPPIGLLALLRGEWYGFFASYWAVFGAFTILAAPWVYVLFGVLTLSAALGQGLAVARQPSLLRRPDLWLLAGFTALTLVGVIRWTMQTPASQGRLMFGAIGPLSIFMAAGLMGFGRTLAGRRWGPATERGLALALGGILAVVAAIIPVAYIAPRYEPPSVLTESDLPLDLRAVNVNMGGGILLLGYTPSDELAQAGGTQAVTLYWKAAAAMERDYSLALHLLGRGGAEVGKLDTWPGGGLLPTSQWEAGAIYADRYELPIAPGAVAPSLLRLDLNFWDADPAQHLPMTDEQGAPLAGLRLEVGRMGPAAPIDYAPVDRPLASLEGGITLLGYETGADGALAVTLYWRLDEGADLLPYYHVFRHLVTADGVLVREPGDSPPLDGDWPTTAWLPGQTVADETLLALPPEMPPGRYNLRVGLYDPDSGARVPAYDSAGARWPDDAVVIEGILER